jgi:tripartite-type tricarboxylate transporter receptor subunit TctC
MSAKQRSMFFTRWMFGLLFLLAVMIQAPAAAAAEHERFADKAIRIIVPYAPGAAYDRLARIVGRRIGSYIPGNPSVLVQNMPGGGGAVATNYLYNVAPKDGTAMAILNPALVLPQLTGLSGVKFDKAKFNWLGSLQNVNVACMVRKEAGLKSFSELLQPQGKLLHFGATAPGSSNYIWAAFLKEIGARVQIVSGYAGAAPIYSAMQQGELDGVCSTWDAMRITARPLHQIGTEGAGQAITDIIVQTGDKPAHDLPKVPLIRQFLKTEREGAIADAFSAPDEVTRAFAVPPGVPPARVSLLRKAFNDVVEDPQLKEMTRKTGDELSPSSGEHVEQVMKRLVTGTSKEVIVEIRRLFGS